MKSDTKTYLTNYLIIVITIFMMVIPIIVVTKDKEITESQLLPITAETEINNQKIKLEIAETKREQDTGLMYRTSLEKNRGMLFKFKSPQKISFWMKNCKIPLDMIFLRDGMVEAIELSAPPCTADPCPSYGPDTAIDRVIELRGGRAAELGVKVGDRVKIEFLSQQTKF
jgi:uncharacterized membrane protein (UPF0127 family)